MQTNRMVCAGSLTITFDPTSGQRSYLNLIFMKLLGTLSCRHYQATRQGYLTALLNRHVKESVAMASKMDCKCVGNEVGVAA